MDNFKKYAKAARARGEGSTARRIEVEGKIVRHLVKRALAAGYVVSVCDGEEWTVRKSRDRAEIVEACFATDEDRLAFRDANGARVGSVYLVYGNDGNDVISDYSAPDLEAFEAFMRPTNEYSDTL